MRRRPTHSTSRPASGGFTLIEMIVVIVISGIIAATIAMFLLGPVRGYIAQVRRAELVNEAESALRRMQRDIRAAVPNSLRIRANSGTTNNVTCPSGPDTVCVIEILHVLDGARYRSDGVGDRLLFNGTDTGFDAIGTFQNASAINPDLNPWVVINNQTASPTATQFNAYNCPAAVGGVSHNCVRMAGTGAGTNLGATPQHVVLGAAFAPTTPPLGSPRQRVFVVDTPVTYRCDTAAGTLDRYHGYPIALAQAVAPAGATVARMADRVSLCRFTYVAGTSQRAGMVTLELTVTDPNVDGHQEQIRLLHQVHVYNVP